MSCDEPCDVYKNETIRARKEHVCCACKGTIKPGDLYARVFVLYEGDVSTYKRCGRCETIHSHLVTMCRGGGSYDWPDEELDCGHEYQERWDVDPPPEIAALAFLTEEEAGRLLEKKP